MITTQAETNDLPDLQRLKTLLNVGIALSAEKDGTRLLEMILQEAKRIAFADGGTLYTRTEDNHLKFEIMLNDTLKLHTGGTSGAPVILPALPLYNNQGEPNLDMVAVCAAIRGKTINIPDAYTNTEFEFSGTRAFDKQTGYRSQSFLTVPMKDHDGEVIGVLQLINALHPVTQKIGIFGTCEQELVESLASQAAVALVNQRLIEDQRRLFEALIQLIATAIDDKSPYTGGHCRRVPELTLMLADAAANTQTGPLKDFTLTEEDRYELKVAGWLHDCGKITTPEYIIDKSTKLETLFDRIDMIDTRFEVLKRDAEIAMLREQLAAQARGETVDVKAMAAQLAQDMAQLDEDREFLHRCNVGGEYMSYALRERVLRIAQHRWVTPEGKEDYLLSEEEVSNLNISRGTLTPEERKIINSHIDVTINMLEALPYPKSLQHVPEYAGGHHEHVDGTGYPKGLTGEQMSIPAKVMGIADIFEALTAKDRPYKKPMHLSQALTILERMKEDKHIDPDLFDVFIREKVYLQYAKVFLTPEQIDEVDVTT
ncbi:MAG: HD domain-containing phosphohydrolase [Candidatus Parabeggiatoa sp.]|nr:HD domain-containing phosphohydrolase [Candidatus Parabeggiatoa sp.]